MIKFNIYGNEEGARVHFLTKEDIAKNDFNDYLENKNFKAELKDILYLPNTKSDSEIFIGLGNQDIKLDDVRNIFFELGNLLRKEKEEIATVKMPDFGICQKKTIMAAYEGLRHGEYNFSKKTKSKDEIFDLTINYIAARGPEEKLQQGVQISTDIMDGVFLARDLVNETGNIIYPETLANITKEKLEEVGVKVRIYEEEEIKKLDMKAFLAVGGGAANRPRLIVMEIENGDSPKTALVGKGLTYDSGGYNIKTAKGMVSMHSDMGGAGSVIGTMYALGKSKAKVNVVAVVAACENMISGTAYKSGDIIDTMKGLTVEVKNTDAEGRLTLADAIFYATNNFKVERVIDLATLTGAVLSALGEEYTGAVTNDDGFYQELLQAAEIAGEKIWAFPYDEDFKKLNNSDVADIANTSSNGAGSVTAGLFVGEFVKEKTKWIHLDIAGTAYRSKAKGYLPKRATGIHVKTLYNLLNPIDC